jgi:hypothetical protein
LAGRPKAALPVCQLEKLREFALKSMKPVSVGTQLMVLRTP